MDTDNRLSLLDSVSMLKSIYTYVQHLHLPHTMWTTSHIRKNEHDSTEESSSYTDHLSDTALPKEESSLDGKLKDQKAKSTTGKSLPPIMLSLSSCNSA